MKGLQYRIHPHQELIDEILLFIGLTGELMMCVVGESLLREMLKFFLKEQMRLLEAETIQNIILQLELLFF